MAKAALLISISLVSLLACDSHGSTNLSSAQRNEIVAEVEVFLESYKAALASRESDAIRKMYIADDRFAWFEDGIKKYSSADDILASLASFPADMTIDTTHKEVTVQPLSPGLATVSSLFDTKVSGGSTPGFGWAGVMTMVVERSEDDWKIVSGHSSTPSPRGR